MKFDAILFEFYLCHIKEHYNVSKEFLDKYDSIILAFYEKNKPLHTSLRTLEEKEGINKDRDLFTRMLAEAEGLRNIQLDKIEKPFNDDGVYYKKIGVRRDLDTIGTGRMELSEIDLDDF